jgi:hypothetical protein
MSTVTGKTMVEGAGTRTAMLTASHMPPPAPTTTVRSSGYIWGYLLLALVFLAVTILVSVAK